MTDTQTLRLAIDIGGTFTDTVVMTGQTVLASAKTLTTHEAPARGALQGALRALAEAGRDMAEVTGLIHGTTLATNALIERRGARVVTLTTEGFRDILEIAYERRYAQYDIGLEKPQTLVPRNRSLTVSERVSASGDVLLPLTDVALADAVAAVNAAEAEAVAVCLLHSYANDAHERALGAALRAGCPGVAVSLSSEVSPEAREFDRLSTTVANAYVQPLMQGYLTEFARDFAARGLRCPILMMTASGGMCTLDTAARYPIRLVESGPAGGAILAARVARQAGADQVLSFDMGGTTAKLCLIDAATPQMARQFEIARAARFIKGSGMPVRIPVIEMIEIGAGGGSIALVDRLGRLTVGPQSAGSEPGPVAFARGGDRPTVTDADLTLGYIQPDHFAEGALHLDAEAAAGALAHQIGQPLDCDAAGGADGISRIVDENMASAARMHAVESGKDLGPRTMIAFGGNGPLHATRVARAAGIDRILIPPDPGVGSAVGFLFAPVSFEIVRSRYSRLDSLDCPAINVLFDAMIAEAAGVVEQGAPDAAQRTERTAFMRYAGQGHEIAVELPDRGLTPEDVAGLTTRFETAYRQIFARPVPGMTIEILNWAVRVSTEPVAVPAAGTAAAARPFAATTQGRIYCDVTASWRDAALIARAELRPGDRLDGPALITEPQTTTLVSADFRAAMDAAGHLVLTRKREG